MSVSEPPGPSSDLAARPHPAVAGSGRLTWRTLVAMAALVAVLYAAGTFADVWVASRGRYHQVTLAPGQVRAAVVLGAAQYNGEPSPVLRGRLDQAAALWAAGQVNLVVVTGGRQPADVTTEAKTGYDYLRETTDIPDEQLRLEVQGGSTYESLAATARFLRREQVHDVVLVTDRYHARRAELIAREVGLNPAVSLTPPGAPVRRLTEETAGVGLGRIIGFRRLHELRQL